jgi:hypothetical protein
MLAFGQALAQADIEQFHDTRPAEGKRPRFEFFYAAGGKVAINRRWTLPPRTMKLVFTGLFKPLAVAGL